MDNPAAKIRDVCEIRPNMTRATCGQRMAGSERGTASNRVTVFLTQSKPYPGRQWVIYRITEKRPGIEGNRLGTGPIPKGSQGADTQRIAGDWTGTILLKTRDRPPRSPAETVNGWAEPYSLPNPGSPFSKPVVTVRGRLHSARLLPHYIGLNPGGDE